MNFICLTLRYPRHSGGNHVYIWPNSILAFAVNMTDHGIVGSVVYTSNPVALHVAEDVETIHKLIKNA